MASRTSLIQSRSIYVGTSNNVAPSDGNLIVTGNVGIGTTSPTSPGGFNKILHISGGYASLVLTSTTPSKTWEIGVNAASLLTFYDGVADRMVINTSGNVGIGTTSPGKKLHVIGDAWINRPSNKVDNNGATEFGSRVEFNNSFASGQSGYMVFRYPTYNNFLIGGDYDGNIGGGIPNIQFGRSNGTIYMHIDANGGTGNVGIGTTSPGAKTHISGGGFDLYLDYSSTNAAIGISSLKKTDGKNALVIGRYHSTNNSAAIRFDYVGDNSSGNYLGLGFYANDDLMVIKPSGNVGIGTTSPSSRLHVKGTWVSNEGILALDADSGTRYSGLTMQNNGTAYGFLYHDNTDSYVDLYATSTNGLRFFTNDTARMYITSAGNVGIGTSSPGKKLDVAGQIRQIGGGDYWYVSSGATFTSSGREVTLSRSSYGYVVATPYGAVKKFNASVAFKTTTSTHLGITFLAADESPENNNYAVILRNVNTVRVQKRVSGTQTYPISEVSLSGTDIDDGNWHTISISFDGAYISVDVDGTNYISQAWTDTTWTSGMVGPTIYDGSVEFNDFSCSELTSKNVNSTLLVSGNVGIGTTSPNSKLEVVSAITFSSIDTFGQFVIKSATGTTGDLLNFGVDSTNGLAFIQANDRGTATIPLSLQRYGGNVGIGTTSPANKLHVVGSSSDTAGTGLLRIEGGGGGGNVSWTFRSTVTNNDLTLDRQYAGAYYQALTFQRSSGNVGIGTTAPDEKLHVVTSNSSQDTYVPGLKLHNQGNSANTGYGTGIEFQLSTDYQDYKKAEIRAVATSGYGNRISLGFWTGGSTAAYHAERIRIDGDTGNVGIGTTSPGEKLQVSGSISLLKHNSIASNGITHYTNDYLYVRGGTSGAALTDDGGVVGFYAQDAGAAIIVTNNADRVTVNSSGNVGIGTSTVTSPYGDKILKIQGSTTAAVNLTVGGAYNGAGIYLDSSSKLHLYNNASVAASITSTGNVGIGTTSPATKLHVAGTSETSVRVSDSGGAYMELYQQATDSYILASNALRFYNGGSERMRITSAGNVGIGTTSTNGRLHVYGGRLVLDNAANAQTAIQINSAGTEKIVIYRPTSTEDLRIYTPAAGDAFSLTQAGNVGIGTTSPSKKLHISGAGTAGILIDNTAYNSDLLRFRTTHYSPGFEYKFWMESDGLKLSYAEDPSYTHSIHYNFFKNGNFTVNTGNVGIGTTTPGGKLHLYGAYPELRLEGNNDVSGSGYISFYRPTNGRDGYIQSGSVGMIYYSENNSQFYSGGTEKMRITSGGNVGIGTTSPSASLDVKGVSDTSGAISLQLRSGNTSSNFDSNQITLSYNNTALYRHAIKTRHNSGASSGNAIDFYTWQYGGLDSVIGGQHVMSLDGGNVGVGITSPTATLHVVGTHKHFANTGAGTNLVRVDQYGTDTNYRLDYKQIVSSGLVKHSYNVVNNGIGYDNNLVLDRGNVGIGTTSPAYKLDIGSNTSETFRISAVATSGSTGNLLFGSNVIVSQAAKIQGIYGGSWDGALAFFTQDAGAVDGNRMTEKVRILSNGNVGIGTTSPAYKLDVNGTTYHGDSTYFGGWGYITWGTINGNYALNIQALSGKFLNFGTDSTTGRMVIDTSGNVGIGTTSPGRKLDINTDGGAGNANNYLRLSASASGAYSFNSYIEGYYNDYGNGEYARIGLIHFEGTRPGANNVGGNIKFYTKTLGGLNSADPTVKMTITADGNVGIGTTSPASESNLTLGAKSASEGGHLTLQKGTSASNATHIDNFSNTFRIMGGSDSASGGVQFLLDHTTGNVGIGATSPDAKLHIASGKVAVDNTSSSTDVRYGGSLLALANSYSALDNIAAIDFPQSAAGSGFSRIGVQYKSRTASQETQDMFFVTMYGGTSSEKMRILGNGNVGIGATNPQSKLTVVGEGDGTVQMGSTGFGGDWVGISLSGTLNTTNYNLLGSQSNSSFYLNRPSGGDMLFRHNNTDQVIIKSGGNVGIGTTSPDSNFHVEDTNPEVRITGTGGTSFPRLLWEYPVSATQASRWALTASASGNTFYLYNYTQSKKIFQVDGTASHITLNHDAAGTTQIGTSTTQTAYQLYVATNIGQTGAIEAAGSVKITSGALGVNIAASATAGRIDASNDIVAYSTSDKRLKENIKPLENATEKVKQLTGVEFDWKQEHKDVHGYEGHDVGVIAQEVQEVLPEAIRTNDSGYLSVRYEKLIGLLIESNKELAARVEELEQKLKQ